MTTQNIFSHFNLMLKIKNQTIQNNKSSKKYSLVKEIELSEGDNFIGSDISLCNIYLPFDNIPKKLGNLKVTSENKNPKAILVDFGEDEEYSLQKEIGTKL